MRAAEFILRSAMLVDVKQLKIRRADIRVLNGRFASIEEPRKTRPKGIKSIDCRNDYVMPGLIDAHTHTELSLLSIAPFAQMLLKSGTTTAIIDPHDFVNVVGMKGLKLLQKESAKTPLRAYFMAPSCVPSFQGVEDSGRRVRYQDVVEALGSKQVLGLAEVMDTARLLRSDRGLLRMIQAASKLNKIVDGHCPGLSLRDEALYMRLGKVRTDHESVSVAEILRKHRRGLWLHLRRTSFGREYPYAGVFRKTKGERLMLSTDGCVSPQDVMKEGHISAFVRELIRSGIDPVDAVRAATINPAQCYGLSNEIGSIETGKHADLVFVKELDGFAPHRTFISGADVTRTKAVEMSFPAFATKTVKARIPAADELKIKVPSKMRSLARITANVIALKSGSLVTGKRRVQMKNSNGEVKADPSHDILKAVVLERFSAKGRPQSGLVKGFGLKAGAFGGSIGQDCQHICVIGTNDTDILTVIDRVIKEQGGIFYAKDGLVLDGLRLPIGGIMTNRPVSEVAKRLERVETMLKKNGVKVACPYLTLSLQITLAAIPALKITNRGLLDVCAGKFIDVVRSA